MSGRSRPLLRRARSARGQALVLTVALLVGVVGLSAFVIDVGAVLWSRRHLQQAVDAAAAAAAVEMSTISPAVAPAIRFAAARTTADAYSALPGMKNYSASLPNVTNSAGYPQARCVTSLVNQGIPCLGSSAPDYGNAIVVKQEAVVPMRLAGVLGRTSMTISATATVVMRGGIPRPFEVVVIVDTSYSMTFGCSAIPGGNKLDCAKAGVRALLDAMWPCQPPATCDGTNVLDRVGLMIFPPVRSTAVANGWERDCVGNINWQRQTSPDSCVGAIMDVNNNSELLPYACAGQSPTYLVEGLASDYKASASSPLNPLSNLVMAVPASSSCGIEAEDSSSISFFPFPFAYTCETFYIGPCTYLAGIINAAQSYLANPLNTRPNATRAIIIISDGDSNAPASSVGAGLVDDQCQAAINAAQAATAAGTWVFSIVYEANTSSGSSCDNDSPAISAYATMQGIASNPTMFYNQPNAAALTDIFTAIASSLTTSRMVDESMP